PTISGYAANIISDDSPSFPARLRGHSFAPKRLIIDGPLEILETPCIGIVGSRDAPDDALIFAEQLAAVAARVGLTVVSGGAQGVDAAVHQGCLQAGGRTIE